MATNISNKASIDKAVEYSKKYKRRDKTKVKKKAPIRMRKKTPVKVTKGED